MSGPRRKGKTLVLLCYEDLRKPDQWCHRTLFAEWWQKMTGEVINELEEADVKPQKAETASVPQQSHYQSDEPVLRRRASGIGPSRPC